MITGKRSSDIALEYITSEIARTGRSKGDLARAMGISASALSKILKKQRQIELGELFLAQRFFDSPDEIEKRLVFDLFPEFKGRFHLPVKAERRAMSDDEAVEAAMEMRSPIKKLDAHPRLFSIFRTSAGDFDGTFDIWDEVADARSRPEPIDISRQIAGIYMAGDVGAPRYDDGELIIFDISRRAAAGEYIIIGRPPDALGASSARIGRLVGRKADKLALVPIGGESAVEVPSTDVHFERRIIPLVELIR